MCCFFFFNDTATTEIYTLSLHDALPIYRLREQLVRLAPRDHGGHRLVRRPVDLAPRDLPGRDLEDHALHLTADPRRDRKSTRLNSSHANISYAVFCLKKKKQAN